MNGRRVVRERIDPRLAASLFATYRSAVDAVIELVDNAVASRVASVPLGDRTCSWRNKPPEWTAAGRVIEQRQA